MRPINAPPWSSKVAGAVGMCRDEEATEGREEDGRSPDREEDGRSPEREEDGRSPERLDPSLDVPTDLRVCGRPLSAESYMDAERYMHAACSFPPF